MKDFRLLRGADGVALVMVLWVIAILSVIAMEFSFAMRTEVQITQNFQEELQLYAMAQGGVERAAAELIYKNDPKIQEMRKALRPGEIPEDRKEWAADGRAYLISYERGECWTRVMGEGGKINVNLVSEKLLRRIVGNLGLEGEQRDIIVDSILDWRDPDDLHRINGAENDYYRSLPEPYECKNANLDTIEELLLIRGVTPELFYGRKAKERLEEGKEPVGLKDLFTLYAGGEQIDINSASIPVLRVVLEAPLLVCQLLVKAREEKIFESQQDLLQRVPEFEQFFAENGRMIQYRSAVPYYTVEARAKRKGGGALRGVKAVLKVDPQEKMGYKVVQWLDVLL